MSHEEEAGNVIEDDKFVSCQCLKMSCEEEDGVVDTDDDFIFTR